MTRKLSTVSKMNQNHRKMYTFSLTIFKGNKQSASCFSTSPDVPNLWNVHLVILGNTYIKGSKRSSWSCSANAITSKPNVRNAPSKKRSIRNIWPEKLNYAILSSKGYHKWIVSNYRLLIIQHICITFSSYAIYLIIIDDVLFVTRIVQRKHQIIHRFSITVLWKFANNNTQTMHINNLPSSCYT